MFHYTLSIVFCMKWWSIEEALGHRPDFTDKNTKDLTISYQNEPKNLPYYTKIK